MEYNDHTKAIFLSRISGAIHQLYPYYAVKDKLAAKHFASPAISAPEKSNEGSSR